jgi:hypothetical protein
MTGYIVVVHALRSGVPSRSCSSSALSKIRRSCAKDRMRMSSPFVALLSVEVNVAGCVDSCTPVFPQRMALRPEEFDESTGPLFAVVIF